MWWIPFLIQTAAITLDEFYFHHKRGLPKWERIGHPLDTLSLIACLLFVVLTAYDKTQLLYYIPLAIFSCLLVTKDEWVHKDQCDGKEQWLHALLFLNHPLVLIALGFMWKDKNQYAPFLWIQLYLTVLFFLYQWIYWNFVWKEKA
jgi:hypothetical protein